MSGAKSRHTPGPWLIAVEAHSENPRHDTLLSDFDGNLYPSHDLGIVDGNPDQLNRPDGFRYLAHLTGYSHWDGETVANARLIAAAPERLEALKALYQAHAHKSPREGVECVPCGVARAAIAKAEGR